MLDNLANVDLSGISTYIRYEYTNMGSQASAVLIGIGAVIFLLVIASVFYRMIVGSRSHQYKEFLADMWVVGKIKQLAEKDNVDLEAEEREFVTRRKREKLYNQSLVSVIEDEVKEQVAGLEEKAKAKK